MKVSIGKNWLNKKSQAGVGKINRRTLIFLLLIIAFIRSADLKN